NLLKNAMASVPPEAAVPGDCDGDKDVDGADFVAWQTSFGQTGSGLSCDFDGDGDVDGADFIVWQVNFPKTAPQGTGSSGILKGDFNFSGIVNEADFDSMIEALSDVDAYKT